MVVGQLGKLTGVPVDAASCPSRARRRSSTHLDEIDRPTLLLGRRRPASSCSSRLALVPARPGPPARRGARDGRRRRRSAWATTGIAVVGRDPGRAAAARGLPRAGRPARRCCCPRSASRSSATPTTCSPPGRSPPAHGERHRRRTRNCSPSARPTSAPGLLHGFPVSSSGSRTAIGGRRRQPHPAVLAGHPRRHRRWRCCSCGPLLAALPRPPRSARSSSTPRSG